MVDTPEPTEDSKRFVCSVLSAAYPIGPYRDGHVLPWLGNEALITYEDAVERGSPMSREPAPSN